VSNFVGEGDSRKRREHALDTALFTPLL